MSPLLESELAPDPLEQFDRWYREALAAKLTLHDGMTLATVGPGGKPSARIVLLKGFDPSGFRFVTNYDSRKARELDVNPAAALVFWWPSLEKQIRVEGNVTRVGESESAEYFSTRPRGSQIGAWASPQSEVISDREILERAAEEIEGRFSGKEIPRPLNWGGYRLRPDQIEFWKGQPDRLHDRFRYLRVGDVWKIERLAP